MNTGLLSKATRRYVTSKARRGDGEVLGDRHLLRYRVRRITEYLVRGLMSFPIRCSLHDCYTGTEYIPLPTTYLQVSEAQRCPAFAKLQGRLTAQCLTPCFFIKSLPQYLRCSIVAMVCATYVASSRRRCLVCARPDRRHDHAALHDPMSGRHPLVAQASLSDALVCHRVLRRLMLRRLSSWPQPSPVTKPLPSFESYESRSSESRPIMLGHSFDS